MLNRFVLLVCILASHAVWAQETQDENNVRALITSFSESWNNSHNPKTMAAHWLENGDLINPWGKRATNRQEVEQIFTEEQNGPLKGSVIQQNIEKVRFLTPTMAWVDSSAKLSYDYPNQFENHTISDHHVVFLVVKRNGKWLIASARPYVFMDSTKPTK